MDGFQSKPAPRKTVTKVEVVKPGSKASEAVSSADINATAVAFLRLLKRTGREESTK